MTKEKEIVNKLVALDKEKRAYSIKAILDKLNWVSGESSGESSIDYFLLPERRDGLWIVATNVKGAMNFRCQWRVPQSVYDEAIRLGFIDC